MAWQKYFEKHVGMPVEHTDKKVDGCYEDDFFTFNLGKDIKVCANWHFDNGTKKDSWTIVIYKEGEALYRYNFKNKRVSPVHVPSNDYWAMNVEEELPEIIKDIISWCDEKWK